MIKTQADLKKELHKAGIKTYRNKNDGKSYVGRKEVLQFLAESSENKREKGTLLWFDMSSMDGRVQVGNENYSISLPEFGHNADKYKNLMKKFKEDDEIIVELDPALVEDYGMARIPLDQGKATGAQRVLAANPTGQQFDEAYEMLESDSEIKNLIAKMKSNSAKYFDTYNKLSDDEVRKGEEIEKELGEKYDARAKELGLERAQNGMWYKA